ncbi:unnamed protein product [Anisakis simplex]|uniref:Prefoldin subunit 2 (inferred by orthology to a C. elegans protein) n=1 Tax=Anisakis simplex TaxID=6269 RepID=A0A0M3K5W6_ANISI|nr:unnamed protein product [Anisakis simplex]
MSEVREVLVGIAKMSTSANEPQEIVENFQKLREQQQDIANEINKVDEETREHKRVIELLEKMPEDKRCYRVVGDTLVEYHVKDILPELSDNVKSVRVNSIIFSHQIFRLE